MFFITKISFKSVVAAMAMLSAFCPLPSSAQEEALDRGLVVAKGQAEGQYFASWRLLKSDAPGTSFTLLRDGKPYKENITGATSLAVSGTPTSRWTLIANAGAAPVAACSPHRGDNTTPRKSGHPLSVLPWSKPYLTLKVTPPQTITNDKGTFEYFANDCSVGDVDGDGQYELIVKWSSRESDNSFNGFTGRVYLSCYKLDMVRPDNAPKCLWTIDLGDNIRAGAHYTQFMVYDFDGDGCAELMCKTAPGSKDGRGKFVNLASDNKEIRQADNSKDWRNSRGRVCGGQEYLTVFSGKDGHAINTVFYQPNRDTGIGGEAKGTFDWNSNETHKDLIDNAQYGNRGERYLACVAYIDGTDKRPCAIFTRGYYTYAFAWAVSFDGKKLHTKWFNESRSGKEYSVTDANGKKTTYTAAPPTSGSGSGTLYGNGNHNLCVADVDGDGKDEMVWGAATLDDDGRMLYATGFGHGDAVHLADLNPSHPGYEVFDVHENKGKYSWDVHDARTGEILLKGGPEGVDNGRGLTAQIDSTTDAYYFWSACDPTIRSAITGEAISGSSVSMNYRIYWDGDLQDELLDGTNITKPVLTNKSSQAESSLPNKPTQFGQSLARKSLILTPFGSKPKASRRSRRRGFRGFQRPSESFSGMGNPASNNWTKNNPCLQCDLFGDWREEVIYRDATDPSILYIYMSQIPTPHRMTTLMQDHLYRLSIAWQNVGYNQPPYKGKKVKK